MDKQTGGILAGIAIIVFFIVGYKKGWFNNPSTTTNTNPSTPGSRQADLSSTTSDTYKDGDLRCDLRDAYGRTITITGSGPEFENLCRQTIPTYYYYYPYTYWIWTGGRWGHHGGHGGHH